MVRCQQVEKSVFCRLPRRINQSPPSAVSNERIAERIERQLELHDRKDKNFKGTRSSLNGVPNRTLRTRIPGCSYIELPILQQFQKIHEAAEIESRNKNKKPRQGPKKKGQSVSESLDATLQPIAVTHLLEFPLKGVRAVPRFSGARPWKLEDFKLYPDWASNEEEPLRNFSKESYPMLFRAALRSSRGEDGYAAATDDKGIQEFPLELSSTGRSECTNDLMVSTSYPTESGSGGPTESESGGPYGSGESDGPAGLVIDLSNIVEIPEVKLECDYEEISEEELDLADKDYGGRSKSPSPTPSVATSMGGFSTSSGEQFFEKRENVFFRNRIQTVYFCILCHYRTAKTSKASKHRKTVHPYCVRLRDFTL